MSDVFYEVMDDSGFLYGEFNTMDAALTYLSTNPEAIEEVALLRCTDAGAHCERVELWNSGGRQVVIGPVPDDDVVPATRPGRPARGAGDG